MTHQLKQGPNGPFIEIDPQLLEAAGIAVDGPVQVRQDGAQIVITAGEAGKDETVNDRERRFQEAMEWTIERYDKTFRKLSE